MTEREQKFYQVVTYSFGVVLLCHILVASFLIFNPNKKYLTDSRFEKAYRLFGLTGPFFSEDRINVVPHVYASIKKNNGEWGEVVELGTKEFNQYHSNYLDYSSFAMSSLPKFLCRQLYINSDSVVEKSKLSSIRNYFVYTNPNLEIDSVFLTYTLESLVNKEIDTLFIKPLGEFDKYYK